MPEAKSEVQNCHFQLNNPYKCPRSSFPQRFPKIDTVSWIIGGTFGILIGILVPLILMGGIVHMVSWVTAAFS